jgi:hypothetical protein
MKRKTVARWAGICGISFALGGCGGALLPSQDEIHTSRFQSYQAVRDAFDKIKPMRTSLKEVSSFGFDAQNASNVRVLSYVDIVNHFVPDSSVALDRLDPAVKACIDARADCQGYEFTLAQKNVDGSGSLFLDLLDFAHTRTETGWSAHVLILVRDGQVIHKVISGEPHVQVVHFETKPLGPAQDLSGIVVRNNSGDSTTGLH